MITYRILAIPDPVIQAHIQSTDVMSALQTDPDYNLFIDTYANWIGDPIPDDFKPYITDGVTSAYTSFEASFPTLQTVTFKGEYPYHRSLGMGMVKNVSDLHTGMKLIISDPWAATGDRHEHLAAIYAHCNEHDIPVFVDRAYIGMSDLDLFISDCVTHIAYSPSKMFKTGKCKVGLCWTRVEDKSPMVVLNEYRYVNNISVALHQDLLQMFHKTYLIDKYRQVQLQLCEELGVTASGTVNIGYNMGEQYRGFNREGTHNRLCLSDMLIDPTQEKIFQPKP